MKGFAGPLNGPHVLEDGFTAKSLSMMVNWFYYENNFFQFLLKN